MSQLAWAHAHEILLWASKGARHTFNYDLINSQDPGSQVSSVWHIPSVPMREKSHDRHPTQKPLRLLRRAVLACTGEGISSSTLSAGLQRLGWLPRNWVVSSWGRKMEREYAELAGRRIGAAERGITQGEIQAIGSGNSQRGRRNIGVKR